MNSTYKTQVNSSFEFRFSREEIESLDILIGKDKAQLVHNHASIEVDLLERDFNKRIYIIKIKGTLYEVKIENELDMLISKMGLALGEDAVGNEIHAPMPGLIIDIPVSEGQEVKEGDVVCVLEAMKMENALLSPKDGVIKSVYVKKSQTVEKGVLLIDFEQE